MQIINKIIFYLVIIINTNKTKKVLTRNQPSFIVKIQKIIIFEDKTTETKTVKRQIITILMRYFHLNFNAKSKYNKN